MANDPTSGSGSGTSGLFGSGSQQSSSGSLFGGGGAANTQSSAGTSGDTSKNLFGSTSANSGKSSSSLFGAGASTPASSGNGTGQSLFNARANGPNQSNTSNVFNSFSTPNKPPSGDDSAKGQGSSLFSNIPSGAPSSTPANKPPSFANPSTTPAGPPPSNSSRGLFGRPSSKPEACSTQGGSHSGNAAPSSDNAPSGSSQPGSGSSLFASAQPNANSGPFGNQNVQSQGSTLFGNPPNTNRGGNQDNQQPTSGPPLSNTPATGNDMMQDHASSAAESSSNPEKSLAPSSTSLFGSTTQPTSSNTRPISASAGQDGLHPNGNPHSDSSRILSPFGNANTTASAGGPSATTQAAASSPPKSGSSLFQATQNPTPTAAATEDSASAATSTGPAAVTGQSAPQGLQGLGGSTAGPTPPPQSRLKNKSMDEIITRWATDLNRYQKEFQTQAEKVAQWDRLLVDNSNSISKLYSKAFQAERDTAEILKHLTLVENQQDELGGWLDEYEREVDELMPQHVGQMDGMQGPDQERERTYKTAERVSGRLEEMGKDLTSIIEEINTASATISKTSKPDDPLSQVVRILNGHLSQLQTIDQGTAELEAKVTAAQRQSQSLGTGTSAADDFYRSYIGRG